MSQAKQLASHLSGYGRYGDSMLMHVNPEEVRALNMMAGIAGRHITTNPETGLPEAFNLFDILPFAVNLIAPGMGTAAQVALGAASGAASSAVEGGDPLTGALTGGVMGGIGSNVFGGASPADAAIKGSTAAANQAANAAAGQATTQAATQAAGDAAGQAAMDAIERASIPANPNAYMTDLFGKGSDEFAANLFSGKNLPYTIAGASALGSMLPGQEYKEEEESYGPKNEWRPGEGYVPFQQAGVRSFTPGMISPTGVEQSWIGYGPSADPSTYRRFADGGQVSVGDQLAAIRGQSGARPVTTLQPEGKGRFARGVPFVPQGSRSKGGMPTQAPVPRAPMAPQVVTPQNPMGLVEGAQGYGAPAFRPALYNPVGMGMKGGDMPQINPGFGGGVTGLSMAKQDTYDDATLAQMRNDRIAALGGMNQGGPIGMGMSSGSSPSGGGSKGGFGNGETQKGNGKGGMTPSRQDPMAMGGGSPQINPGSIGLSDLTSGRPTEQRNNPMQMPTQAPQAGNNDAGQRVDGFARGGYVRGYADGGEVKSNDLNDFFTMGAVPFALNKIMDGGPWKLGLIGLPNLLNDRDKDRRGMPPVVGQDMPGQAPAGPGMRNGGYVRRYADGGPVMGGIAQGMQMPPMQEPAPMGVPMDASMPQGAPQIDDQTLVRAAAAAISGQIPNGEPIIQLFVAKFGEQALQQLMAMVNPPVPENMGRLLKGPGDGRSDSIPAAIDGVAPAKLSTGEFVVPAKAVSKLGRGSTDAGAQKLQSMVNKVNRKSFETAPGVIDDMEPMRV